MLDYFKRVDSKTTFIVEFCCSCSPNGSCCYSKNEEFEKFVVRQFDEIMVMTVYEYNIVNDKVLGPHSQIQVVMIRSLFATWKQPIFIDSILKITKAYLYNNIKRLY